MTSDEVRRITERRNEAAAAMDECELAEAHRDEESSARSSDYNMRAGEPNPFRVGMKASPMHSASKI